MPASGQATDTRAGWLGSLKLKYSALRERQRARAANRTPDQKSKHTRRRRRIIFAAIVALLAYPVLGTLALWTGLVERMLASEDLKLEIDNPAYTIWPGRIHMKRVKIMVNGDTQFTLEGHGLLAHIRVFPLFKKRLKVTDLNAHDIVYRMRVQVESDQGIKERLAAYPPLPELPGAKVIREDQAQKTEERDGTWTVDVEGIDIDVNELWFMEYRYVGDGTLRGGFVVGPNLMRVGTSVQDIGPGELRFGAEEVIARDVRGRIEAAIPQVNPKEHADESFLELVTADLRLGADVVSLRHLSAYLDGMNIADGKGRLDAHVGLAKGELGKDSELHFTTDSVRLLGKGFGVKTDFTVDAAVARPGDPELNGKATAGKISSAKAAAAPAARPAKGAGQGDPKPEPELPRMRARMKSSFVSLAQGPADREFTIQIHGHEHQAILKSVQLGSAMTLKSARMHMPNIYTNDFDDLAALIGTDAPINAKRGEARASVTLNVNDKQVARGPFKLSVTDLLMKVAGVDVGGRAVLNADVLHDVKGKTTVLEDFKLSLADVLMHVGDERVEDWWINLASQRIFFQQAPKTRYEATLGVRAKDAEPILEALAEKDKLNDLVAKFTSLDDLRTTVTVRGVDKKSDVMIRSFESDVWDFAGRVYSDGEKSRVAMLVGGKAVSVGVAVVGDKTEVKPFAGADWLNAQLRQFPKPLEQVEAPKP